MKKKAFKRTRRHIQSLLDTWLTQLGLKWWSIEVRYYDSEKGFRKADGRAVAMRVTSDWRYMSLCIDVNTPACARQTDDDLERIVVHELSHALVNEMREGGIDHEERVVTTLTKAFMWVRDLTRSEATSEAD